MRPVHVLLLAETLPDAERLASAWRAAAPHATTEAREVRVPGSSGTSDGGSGDGGAPAAPGHLAGPAGGGVLLAGTAIPVGRPAAVGPQDVGPAHPGPTAPGPAPSALPRGEGVALAEAAAGADVVVAYVTRLDGDRLHRGVVVEAAAAAAPHAVPVVVVTERSEVSRREWSTAGLSGVHEAADGDVARVARTWTPGWAH
ncbi:hypothetical protein [Promicromonospora iranensis]|uniref:Uncharacterized protein n=1 Tax=Promicromonospora iranensis TaxID=1105144 RepID=A0ABU2CU64_9MICO|nr:hypothetical protein [Promicromonospora iranensis]MDR7384875.1 hypothetical protein [Promicromonospora iranensis]